MSVQNFVMKWFNLKILVLGVAILHRCTVADDEFPRFARRGYTVLATAGGNATLACHVANHKGFQVAWLRLDSETVLTLGDRVITENHRVRIKHIDDAWTLTLKNVIPIDEGRYMCQVNTNPMMTQTHLLQVLVPPKIENEHIDSEMFVKEGDNLFMPCVASGIPNPKIMWRREDSRPIKIDNQTSVKVLEGKWLNLTSVERESSGAYLCNATNQVHRSTSKRFLLKVMFAPSARTGLQLVQSPAGVPLSLQCTCEGFPVPQMYWSHNGAKILKGTNRFVSNGDYYHTLTMMLAKTSLDSEGNYRCQVNNTMGQAHAEVYLRVLPVTTAISTTPSSMMTSEPCVY